MSSEKNIESINLKPRHIHSHAPTTNTICPKIYFITFFALHQKFYYSIKKVFVLRSLCYWVTSLSPPMRGQSLASLTNQRPEFSLIYQSEAPALVTTLLRARVETLMGPSSETPDPTQPLLGARLTRQSSIGSECEVCSEYILYVTLRR